MAQRRVRHCVCFPYCDTLINVIHTMFYLIPVTKLHVVEHSSVLISKVVIQNNYDYTVLIHK